MLINGKNITSTGRLLQVARKGKMFIIVKGILMFKTLGDNYNKKKVKWIGNPLRGLNGDIAIYRIDTFSDNEVKRINRYLKKNEHGKVYYNTLKNVEILET